MTIIRNERRELIRQLAFLKTCAPKGVRFFQEAIDRLAKGYERRLYEAEQELAREVLSRDGVFVFEALLMYQQVDDYRRVHPEDREVSEHLYAHFLGFDGKHEGKFAELAEYMVEKLALYKGTPMYRLAPEGYDSHWPMVEMYRRMVASWEAGGYRMRTHEEVMRVLDAREERINLTADKHRWDTDGRWKGMRNEGA